MRLHKEKTRLGTGAWRSRFTQAYAVRTWACGAPKHLATSEAGPRNVLCTLVPCMLHAAYSKHEQSTLSATPIPPHEFGLWVYCVHSQGPTFATWAYKRSTPSCEWEVKLRCRALLCGSVVGTMHRTVYNNSLPLEGVWHRGH